MGNETPRTYDEFGLQEVLPHSNGCSGARGGRLFVRWMSALAVCLLFAAVGVSRAQEKPSNQSVSPSPSTSAAAPQVHGFIISPQDKARKNPMKFTEESVERGKSLYATQCAMCHGKSGNGKGDLATVMHISPPDFTKADTLANRTDGELYAIIKSGSATMPSQANRLKDNQVWDLINFLRTLQGKTPENSARRHSAK